MSYLPEVAHPHRKRDPSDLSDCEWQIVKPLLPGTKGFGRLPECDFLRPTDRFSVENATSRIPSFIVLFCRLQLPNPPQGVTI
jgi:hypothetical protein